MEGESPGRHPEQRGSHRPGPLSQSPAPMASLGLCFQRALHPLMLWLSSAASHAPYFLPREGCSRDF